MADRAAAMESSVRWAEPFGAVRLAERPSWRTALPQIGVQHSICSSCRTASAATPSERTYPFARASNVLHRPSTDSMPASTAPSVAYGVSLRLTACATPLPHSIALTAHAAMCTADSAEAQALSILKQGPWSPSTKQSRPDDTDTLSEDTEYTELRAAGG
eukprot:2544938-Prymnesium_polylepis.1